MQKDGQSKSSRLDLRKIPASSELFRPAKTNFSVVDVLKHGLPKDTAISEPFSEFRNTDFSVDVSTDTSPSEAGIPKSPKSASEPNCIVGKPCSGTSPPDKIGFSSSEASSDRNEVLRKSSRLTVLVVLVIWGIAVLGFLQHQAISDWWRLRGYVPNQKIVVLADQNKFTDRARRLFYVYHPSVADASTFNQKCSTNNEYSIILGCYISGQGIYVFKVDDTRLNGVEQVTSAHELLHAAYERLSGKERQKLDSQLSVIYSQVSNQRIKDTVEQYRASDPSVVPNELHSILATELRQLTPELEKYYSRYFIDRSVVVGYSEAYESAFSERKAKIDTLEAKLKSLREQINERSEVLANTEKQLASEYSELESLRDSIEPQTFNARASTYNRQVSSYNREVQSISALIDSYNTIYNEYKQLVTESQDLYKSINSRPETLPSS